MSPLAKVNDDTAHFTKLPSVGGRIGNAIREHVLHIERNVVHGLHAAAIFGVRRAAIRDGRIRRVRGTTTAADHVA